MGNVMANDFSPLPYLKKEYTSTLQAIAQFWKDQNLFMTSS